MLSTSDSFPMWPCAVYEIEEWNIGYSIFFLKQQLAWVNLTHYKGLVLHWHQSKWYCERHSDNAPCHTLTMESLSLRRKLFGQFLGLLRRYDASWKYQFDFASVLELLAASSSRQWRDWFETPFFEWDASECLVSVLNKLLLPSWVLLFPVRPGCGRFASNFIGQPSFSFSCGDAKALGIQQRPASGHGYKKEAHDEPLSARALTNLNTASRAIAIAMEL